MPNIYEVHFSDGSSYKVSTEDHHDDHPGDQFKALLMRIIERSASQTISGVILRVIFKGCN